MFADESVEDPRLQTGYSFVPEMTSEERRASLNLCGPHVMDFMVPRLKWGQVRGETKTRKQKICIYKWEKDCTEKITWEKLGVIDVGEDIIYRHDSKGNPDVITSKLGREKPRVVGCESRPLEWLFSEILHRSFGAGVVFPFVNADSSTASLLDMFFMLTRILWLKIAIEKSLRIRSTSIPGESVVEERCEFISLGCYCAPSYAMQLLNVRKYLGREPAEGHHLSLSPPNSL